MKGSGELAELRAHQSLPFLSPLTSSTFETTAPTPWLVYKSPLASLALPPSMAFSSSVLRARFPVLAHTSEVDHLIVGGGVIGLAIAERLVKRFPNRSTYLVEKHDSVGQETRSVRRRRRKKW